MVTKIILLIRCIALSTSSSAQELEDIFKDGKVSSQLSAFWYDGDTLTLGGILSYKTAPYEGFRGRYLS